MARAHSGMDTAILFTLVAAATISNARCMSACFRRLLLYWAADARTATANKPAHTSIHTACRDASSTSDQRPCMQA